MFYAHFVLSKKGPLARIWLAAHWDKKLTKAHVFETNIESSVEGILQPKVKMALRTSGHLLLGVVRIYSRKAKYLLADCNEAFIKIKMAFRPGVVDLPEDNREAAVATITLPEVFHDFDTAMPDLNDIDVHAQFTLNQSRAEEITMREDYGNITLVGDDGFGDMGFEDAEIVREASNMEETLDHASLLFGKDKDKEDVPSISASHTSNHSAMDKHVDLELDAPLRDDGFGGGVGEGLLSAETGGLFEPGGLFDDAPMEHVPMDSSTADRAAAAPSSRNDDKKRADGSDDEEDDYYDMGPASMGAPSSGPSSPASPAPLPENADGIAVGEKPVEETPVPPEQTTLIQNEDETFALAPLDNTTALGLEKNKTKRKRKLIVDEVKNISGEEMKSQLSDTTDIVTTLDLAPPTKRLMHWKETGGVEKLFALPGKPISSRILSKLYQHHLTTRAVQNEDFGMAAEDDVELETENQKEKEEVAPVPNAVIIPQPLPPQPHPRKRRHEPAELPIEPHPLEAPMPQPSLSQPLAEEPLSHYPKHIKLPAQVPIPSFEDEHQLPPVALPEELQPIQPAMTPIPQIHQQMPTATMVPPQQISPSQSVHTNPSMTQPLHHPEEPFLMCSQQEQQQPQDQHFNNNQTQPDAFMEQMFTPQSNNHYLNDLRPQPTPYVLEDEDEMECPPSVGPPEEQGADETYEQFEERVLNKRAQQMLHLVKSRLERQEDIKFADLVRLNNRKQVAQKFYTFLVLKKQQAVELTQEVAFGDLFISRGPKLETVY